MMSHSMDVFFGIWPYIQKASDITKIAPTYCAIGAVVGVPSMLMIESIRGLIWVVACMAYPMYRTTVAINDQDMGASQKWLEYWIVFITGSSLYAIAYGDIIRLCISCWLVYSASGSSKSGSHGVFKYVISPVVDKMSVVRIDDAFKLVDGLKLIIESIKLQTQEGARSLLVQWLAPVKINVKTHAQS